VWPSRNKDTISRNRNTRAYPRNFQLFGSSEWPHPSTSPALNCQYPVGSIPLLPPLKTTFHQTPPTPNLEKCRLRGDRSHWVLAIWCRWGWGMWSLRTFKKLKISGFASDAHMAHQVLLFREIQQSILGRYIFFTRMYLCFLDGELIKTNFFLGFCFWSEFQRQHQIADLFSGQN